MAHVYGDLDAFRKLLSGGDKSRDPQMLTVLESSSRAVDAFCQRGSGFGPVIETRTFRCSRHSRLLLEADLLGITALTVNGTAVSPLPSVTARTRTLTGYRGDIAITGPWSYDYQLLPAGTVTDDPLSDSATTLTPSSLTGWAPGQTVLVEDEQMFVLDTDDTTATVIRGMNGTTAAEHIATTAIQRYRYDQRAVDATLRVAQRRWKQRDGGVSGVYGGGSVPVTMNFDTEWSILLSTVNDLRFGFVR